MDGGCREDGHLARRKDLGDGAGAILVYHESAGLAGNSNDEVGGTGVDVWWEHTAGAEVEHGHCHALADCGWEGGSVGVDDSTWSKGVLVRFGEVEQPVVVIGKKLHAVKVRVGHAELGDEVRVRFLVDGIDRSHDG